MLSINPEPVLLVVGSTSVFRGSPCCEVDSVIIYLLKCVDTHLNKLWSTVRVIYTTHPSLLVSKLPAMQEDAPVTPWISVLSYSEMF